MQYKRILAVGDIHGIGGVTVRKKASLKAMYIMKGTGNQKYGFLYRGKMIYFTSDLHFYHDNIIHHCQRPFWSSDDMNDSLIENWNDTVSPDDEVYILGDVTMEGPGKAFAMLSQLKGIKYLIRGNHDRFVDNKAWQQYSWVFQWVKDYHELVWNNQKFVLFHYPIEEWADFYKGAIHLHGHQHNSKEYNYQQVQAKLRRYDVGVDANDFKPVSIETIVAFLGA